MKSAANKRTNIKRNVAITTEFKIILVWGRLEASKICVA
jgi:hypothetical protein